MGYLVIMAVIIIGVVAFCLTGGKANPGGT